MWMDHWHKTGFAWSVLQVFDWYSFFGLLVIWNLIYFWSFHFLSWCLWALLSCSISFSFLPLGFWFFGAPLVPFTRVSFVDTHLLVSTYALLSSRTFFRHARGSGCHIYFCYLLWLTLLIGNVYNFWHLVIRRYRFWWSQFRFTYCASLYLLQAFTLFGILSSAVISFGRHSDHT